MSEAKAAAAGAVDFKGWYIVVWLTAGSVVWPRRCACCRRRPETLHAVMDEDRVLAQHPICRICHRHATADEKAMGAAMLAAAIIVVGGWVALFGFSVMYRIGLQLVLMLLAFVVTAGAIHWVLGLFFNANRSGCPDEGWPVETYKPAGFGKLLGKDAERTDDKNLRLWCSEAATRLGSGAYALQLRNYEYAKEFIGANHGDPERIQTIHEAF